MKKNLYVLGITLVVILGAANSARALITCPAGSHTFSGGTQASGYDMCIPDIGSSGPASGSSSQSGATFTPSSKGTITPSGTTSDTQSQGIALDTQVDSEVYRLSGTSIFAQAKALYDSSVSVNKNDFNSVVNQVKNVNSATADSLKRAYNVRAIERLNQVWNQIMALEASYAEQLKKQTTTPPATSPATISPTPINPTTINPTQINPTQISPTEINPTGISPTAINPTPINPTPVIAQYYAATDIKPGQTITAPTDQPANIIRPDQSIYMQAGSIIKFVSQNVWQTVNGIFRFLEKTAIDGRYKVRTNGGAVMAVRGTQFIIKETANTTTVTLLKGSLTATPAKGNGSVTLKEGYQLVINKGVLGKPVKFNAAQLDSSWYANIPAGANFTNASWQKTSTANNWSNECAMTARPATATETLTADEQVVVDSLNQKAIPVFRVHEIDTFAGPTKISTAREKTTFNNGTKVMNTVIDGKSLYYSGDNAGKVWKVFQEKDLINSILRSAKSQNIVYGIDQNTMAFDHWDKAGNTRIAVYNATATQDGTDSLIHNALDSTAPSSPEMASVKIYVNEDTGQWIKTEASVNYPTGKILMPLYRTCNYSYDKAKIKVPAKAKSATAKDGLAEIQQIYNATQ